ncbi:tyrosine-protein phosphatase [Streptomyces sp. 4N509B]|uniref:tyrosine-protein phosphatase n=1 Tax=Streptomyces sp. 4N509B TaxID=3457413 RepID=UPI003FD2B946
MTHDARPQEDAVTPEQATEPVLTGVRNFRDVGGLPTTDGRRVRRGRLYRSGHLAQATPADQAFLASLGLHTVFDFRNSADQALEGPDVTLPGVRNVNIPLTDAADGADFWQLVRDGSLSELRTVLSDGQGEATMIASYRTMILTRTAEHGRVVRALAAGETPALLHCAAGKDRAGLTVAVILLALGVERDAIVEDYLKSGAPHRRYVVRRGPGMAEGGRSAREVVRLLAPFFDARLEYLRAAFAQIDQTWGGVDGYLSEGLALGHAERERLRDHLLTPAPRGGV